MIPVVKAKLLEGKKGLIVGIANENSIAWGCAKAFRALGADLAVTYLNDKAKKYVEPLARDPRDTHALHLYVVRVDVGRFGLTRDELQQALTAERISTSIHFLPVHRLTWYRVRYPSQPSLPVAERAGDEILSLPLSPAHSDDDITDVIEALGRIRDRSA